MPLLADLQRSLTAKVLLGLLGLGAVFGATYVTARFVGIRPSVEAREGARARVVAEPMRFALENLADRRLEPPEQAAHIQRLVERLSNTGGIRGAAVTDASGRRLQAFTGDVEPLRGAGGDLPQRAQSLNRTLVEPSPDGSALLLAVPLRRPAHDQAPSEAFGVLLMQYDLAGPVAERQAQSLRDLGVLALGLLAMAAIIVLGLRRFILTPLAGLAGQAAALGAGNLAARSGVEPPPGGGDEIARLAAGFDRMAAQMEAAAKAQRSLNEELRASEARGRAVFEHASIAISQGDALGRILDANPAFLRLWGYTLEELKGVRWIDLTHPDDRAESLRQSGRLLAGEIDGFALEKRYVRGDGRIVWASVNVACMRGEKGQVEMLVLVAEDITPRKAAEEARAERQQLFQAMFENNQTMQVLVDPDTATIIDVNHAAAAFYGFSREEMHGPISRINPLPEERIRAIMGQAMGHGGVFRVPHRLKSGEDRQMELTIAPFRLGARSLLHTTLHDITERLRAEQTLRETEERLRSLIELMNEGVVLTTAEGRLRYVNPAFARLFGEEPAALEGRLYADLLTPEAAAGQPDRHAARRSGSREPYEAGYLRRDGSGILARVTPFPMFNGEGEYQGSCAIIQDITEARAREQADQLRRKRRSGLLRLHGMHQATRQELLDFSLEQVLALTASPIGYIYGYDDTRRRFTLHSWSEGVMEQCAVQDKKTVYDLDATGVWGDAVRLREPVLLNDFAAAHPGRKGLPEGHVPLSRFLTLPVIRAGRVVAVVGVANKEQPYDDEDIIQLRMFTDGLWSVLERHEALAELKTVTERFHLAVRAGRIGLWDWDLQSGAMHCDAFMEKAFGLSGQNLTGTPEDWVCRVHPEDRPRVREALEIARATGERIELSFRVRRPDAPAAHMTTQAVTYRGPQDEPLRMVGVVMDVTSQRQAEEQLAESHRFLQSVIDTLPTPFVCKDGDGRYLLVNQAFTSLYGLAPERILGRTMDEFLLGDIADRHMAEDDRLLSDPSLPSLEYEVAFTPPGGETRHWLVVKSRLPLAGGRSPGLAAITLDITARKRVEEALRESEVRFRTLTQISPVGIFQADARGRCTYVNDQWSAISGLPGEAALGRNWLNLLRPEDRKRALRGFSDIGRTGQDFVAEFQFGSAQARGAWVLLHAAAERGPGGAVTGFVGALTDISDLKRAEGLLRMSEERFRDLFLDAPLPYQSLDGEGRLLLANEAWLNTLGYRREEVIGKSFADFLRPDQIPLTMEVFPRFKESGVLSGTEFVMRRKDGTELLASFNGRVSRDKEGRFIRTHCTFQDITERRRAEETLSRAKAEAEAATLAKAQFLANMSHEIRTPLGGVIGAAKLLSQSRLSSDQRQLADMAVESGRALLEIVNDILDFSKIEAGRLDLRPEPFALRADLEAVVAPFRLLAGQRGITLRLMVDLNAPDLVVGDHGRLDQVLRNLLGNAVKFTDSGSITLDVATDPACPKPQSSACLRFTVRDTGIGIAPDYLPYIFDSFSQADDSYSKRHGGTGLGLAISRSLVERMGGQLTVTSTVNQGSAFSFTLCLPLAEQPPAAAAPEPARADAAPGLSTSRDLRVLLAEDGAIARTLLTRILSEAGHAVTAVVDGRQALEALSRESFDLVLMDVQMPEVDGLAATRAIRQGQTGARNADIPIVALTAYIQREDRERFLRAGMDDYVPKPVEEHDLLAAMERVLALRDGPGGFGPSGADDTEGTHVNTGSPAQAARFDAAYLERAFGDRKDLLAELLVQFRDASLPEIERNLRVAIEAGDLASARQAAHKAKGTFGTVGARRAAVMAHSLEMAAAAGKTELFLQRAQAFLTEVSALAEHLLRNRPWPDRPDKPDKPETPGKPDGEGA